MKRNPIILIVLVLALVTMACGIQFNLPVVEVKTGPTVTEDISIPAPDKPSEAANLTLEFGAGEISLDSGAENALVTGNATYNVADFKPEVEIDGNDFRLSQGDLEINGIPNFNKNIKNEWNLKLGDALTNLKINAGAYKADYELGGLSLKNLEIKDGAAEVDLAFNEPNLVEMDTFRYITGASDITLTGLANANFDNMILQSGAGSYRLEFTGELQRDASVRIEAGLSTVTVIVPQGSNAVVEIVGGLSNVDLNGDWQRQGGKYVLEGEGPVLQFMVKMGAGTLKLDN